MATSVLADSGAARVGLTGCTGEVGTAAREAGPVDVACVTSPAAVRTVAGLTGATASAAAPAVAVAVVVAELVTSVALATAAAADCAAVVDAASTVETIALATAAGAVTSGTD